VADHLASYLERAGRLDQAMTLWREAIEAGSDIPNTFDRLSLALERAGDRNAAIQVYETGLARFSRVVRRYKYVQQIERRVERYRARIGLGET
jgi:tetratricopeptide (TPR) repeat protein